MKKKILRFFNVAASLELTVYSLTFFLILVIWGTIFQASHGLYAAQKTIFHAWIFWLAGVVPLPGLVLTGLVLSLNLVMALVLRIRWSWRNTGLLLIHFGIIFFLVGGFLSRHLSQESFLTLAEGEASAFSYSPREWELAIWTQSGGDRRVSALGIAGLRRGETLNFKTFDLSFRVLTVYERSRQADGGEKLPALSLQSEGGASIELFGGQESGVSYAQGGQTYFLGLRPRRFPLPVEIKLLTFRKETYPGSEIPRSFASQVELTGADGFLREARISMNRPLRIGAYAFYQSSYDDAGPVMRSTFSVVRNVGRLLPYYASLLTFLGLLWFMLQSYWPGHKQSGSLRGVDK